MNTQALTQILTTPTVTIAPHPVGPKDAPEAHLIGEIVFGHTPFYLELFEVRVVDGVQVSVLPEEETIYSDLANAIQGDGPLATVTVNGREYAMFIYPCFE